MGDGPGQSAVRAVPHFNNKTMNWIKNLWTALAEQGPWKRAYRNFIITGNAWGIFHRNSHISFRSGKPKVMYNTKKTAQKAADFMKHKHDKHFSVYKCVFCTGYHLGKNRDNK